jgi:hypothetical protein
VKPSRISGFRDGQRLLIFECDRESQLDGDFQMNILIAEREIDQIIMALIAVCELKDLFKYECDY